MKEYFTDDEFKCKCCGMMNIDKDFRRRLNMARGITGFPWVPESGCRCEKHNKEVGSVTLNHVVGKAADIRCVDAKKRYQIVDAMMVAGIRGIGIGKTFVHGDTNRELLAIWTY